MRKRLVPGARRRPPYGAYAAITGSFAGLLGAAASAGSSATTQCQPPLDLVVLPAASFKAARTLARDEVTSFIREPFTEEVAHEGGEHPVKTGDMQQAIGELIMCSRCADTWVAAWLA